MKGSWNKISSLVVITASALMLSGCLQKTSSKKATSSTNPTTDPVTYNPINPDPGPTPIQVPAVPGTVTATATSRFGDAGQTIEYYKLNNPPVVVHGAGDGEVVWSSVTDMPGGIPESVLYTNSRLNIRVIPRRQAFGADSRGVACQYTPRPYEKLQVGIRVRKREAAFGDYYLFDNVKLDCASKVHEFQVPQNTAHPVVVEVMNVKWDWSCQSYANQGFPNVAGVCPWDNVWLTECVGVEVQISTDTTKDLPGIRSN